METNAETHAWGVSFAAKLLEESGYVVTSTTHKFGENDYSAALRVRIFRDTVTPDKFVRVTGGRVLSADIRGLLDKPPYVGGMRVKYPEFSF